MNIKDYDIDKLVMHRYKPDYLRQAEKVYETSGFDETFKVQEWMVEKAQKDAYIEYEKHMSQKALDEVLMSYFRQYHRRMIESGKYNDKFPILRDILNDNAIIAEKLDNTDTDYVFITISPPNEYPLDDFKKKVEKVVEKVWIMSYIYVFEQRYPSGNNQQLGDGKHCHLLIHRNGKKYSHIVREIQNTFKSVVDVKNKALCNFKVIKNSDYSKVVNYIKGEKNDISKHEKQKNDIIWRELNGLKPYYEV